MEPTKVDFKNTDDPKVQEKMRYVYSCENAPAGSNCNAPDTAPHRASRAHLALPDGISMFKKGFITEDALKDAVLNKVASRVSMDGPGFDKWLEVPAVV